MPAGKSIYTLRGEVTVDDAAANEATRIGPTSVVRTGDASRVIFVVGSNAFLLRSNSQMRLALSESGGVTRALRLLSGRLLSVFGKSRMQVKTPITTIGIRGTGVYVESEPDFSYVCTCYGETELTADDDPASTETIVSKHHDAPRYVLAEGASGQRIKAAPFKNHTDEELALIEALTGHNPPFSVPGEYGGPRRDY
jgi:hypothetical protein